MGYYVNPTDECKEAFLDREGVKVNKFKPFAERPPGSLPVVLVDNGAFTAAGVAYDADEQETFTLPHDKRSKQYYYVSIEKLKEVTPGLSNRFQ